MFLDPNHVYINELPRSQTHVSSKDPKAKPKAKAKAGAEAPPPPSAAEAMATT